ncbi:MAG: PLP-dependent aminotransferase family protein [Proteobacteria bacterium]|nr:PLP-dependent aminotransferase family protein [Pseudomonadota bacterium]
MTDALDLSSFRSRAAQRGRPGYWDFPEVQIKWAFEAGLPDPRTFPIDDLVRISERVLREDADDALQYGGGAHGSIVYGWEGLRDRLAERTRRVDGREVDRRGVLLTSGGVQGISLFCQAFLDEGDAVAVELPTWEAVVGSVQRLGAEPIAVPVDGDGLRVDLLEKQIEALRAAGRRLKFVYTIATFHTPTGVCLSLERRRRLLELARQWDFLVLEDNVYGELRYSGETLPTLFALDTSERVVKIDSFSKTVAPALRLGWVTGHPDAIAALSAVRGDLGVSQWVARVAETFLTEGLYEPHLDKIRAVYRDKRDVALAALEQHCAGSLHWNVPDGGYFLWCTLADGIDGREVMKRAFAEGVVCRPGERFCGDPEPAKSYFRLAFTMVPHEAIEPGIAVLGRAIAASTRS